MRTFLQETELIYKHLKEGAEATNDVFVLEKHYVQQTGWDKPVFLCKYRGVNFLFLRGNAWNTPELSSALGNLKERDRFCLFCDFLIYLHREEPSLISPAITAYEKGEFSTFLGETAQGTEKEELSNNAREILDLWNMEKEITNNIFSEPTVDDLFKEACELLPEYKEKLKGFYDAIGVENPTFKPPKFLFLWKKTGEGQYTFTFKWKQGQTPFPPPHSKVIFFSEEETETEEKLLSFQFSVGIYLFQKRKLSEEEKNELYFIKQKLNIKIDDLKFVETLWNFRGTASPGGLQVCFRKRGKGIMSLWSPEEDLREPEGVTLEGFEEAEEVEEDHWLIEEDNREKKKSLYRKGVTRFPPRFENPIPVGLVAKLLEIEFSYLHETFAYWENWVYNVLRRNKIEVFKWRKGVEPPDDAKVLRLEREFPLPNNVKYVTGSYLITQRGLEELKKLAREQREQSQKRKNRAYLIKCIARKKGVTIRQAQKIAKGKTDEELTKYV